MVIEKKKIIVYGAGGFIGQKVCQRLDQLGYDVLPIDIKGDRVIGSDLKIYNYNILNNNLFDKRLEKPFAIINLTGENIFGYWSKSKKARIINSRLEVVQKFNKQWSNPSFCPKVYISASAVGYYGDTAGMMVDEFGKNGSGFLANLVFEWENKLDKSFLSKIRAVYIRTGIVLGGSGGILKKILPFYRVGLGGPIADGKFFFPWVSIDDIAEIYIFSLRNQMVKGPVNAVAPQIITYKEFSRFLASSLGVYSFFRIPKIALRLRFGGLADEISRSVKVYPGVLISLGYKFIKPKIENAFSDFTKSNKKNIM